MADGLTGGTAGLISLVGKAATAVFLGTSGVVLWLGAPASDEPAAEIVNAQDEIVERATAKAAELAPADDEGGKSPETVGESAWEVDYEGMIERLKAVGGVEPPEPKPDPKPDPKPTDGEQGNEPVPDPEPDIEVFYLGMIDEGTRQIALVRVGEVQRFMPVGSRRSFLIPDDAYVNAGIERPQGDEEATVLVEVTSIETGEIGLKLGDEATTVERQVSEGVAVASAGTQQPPRARENTPRQPQPRQTASEQTVSNSEVAARRAELIKQRPQREDFTNASGETDIDAYRTALREWSDELRSLNRQNGQSR